jgi:hypothetical protein
MTRSRLANRSIRLLTQPQLLAMPRISPPIEVRHWFRTAGCIQRPAVYIQSVHRWGLLWVSDRHHRSHIISMADFDDQIRELLDTGNEIDRELAQLAKISIAKLRRWGVSDLEIQKAADRGNLRSGRNA